MISLSPPRMVDAIVVETPIFGPWIGFEGKTERGDNQESDKITFVWIGDHFKTIN